MLICFGGYGNAETVGLIQVEALDVGHDGRSVEHDGIGLTAISGHQDIFEKDSARLNGLYDRLLRGKSTRTAQLHEGLRTISCVLLTGQQDSALRW